MSSSDYFLCRRAATNLSARRTGPNPSPLRRTAHLSPPGVGGYRSCHATNLFRHCGIKARPALRSLSAQYAQHCAPLYGIRRTGWAFLDDWRGFTKRMDTAGLRGRLPGRRIQDRRLDQLRAFSSFFWKLRRNVRTEKGFEIPLDNDVISRARLS